ncbi:hypothetical protein RchiOBHm_Chr0c29g0501131 [Rosa chinensis]|uniref:Prefoldin n=1 Tax=Rosa chinensis TaxID=74649 RepID=A0A2P6SQB5_ROSCH|nr:hypothetical protein RchiOBHm_Chr0c29g0501131 [Rosa chinensis]
MASGPPPSSLKANTAAGDPKFDLVKQIRSHEVAIAELNALSSSRTVYQKNGNLFSVQQSREHRHLNRNN